MGPVELVETLKDFILKNRLPSNDLALFGVLCPLCGKTDRIRQLESPEELSEIFETDDAGYVIYTQCWETYAKPPLKLGVCKFCNTPLLLDLENMKALWIVEP